MCRDGALVSHYTRSGNRLEFKYSPDQDRDELGRFGSGSSGSIGGISSGGHLAARAAVDTMSSHTRESRAARDRASEGHAIARDKHVGAMQRFMSRQ